jgi:hypothetical protein
MRKTPARTRLTPRMRAAFVAVAIAAISGTTIAGSPASAAPTGDTTQFRGVNWADPRDNYADDPVVLSGLSLSDSYAQTYAKASRVISAFRANLGANTVRLPINPYTVNGSYRKSYRGVIDAASARGFKVILSYWEGTGARRTASSTTRPPTGPCGTPWSRPTRTTATSTSSR